MKKHSSIVAAFLVAAFLVAVFLATPAQSQQPGIFEVLVPFEGLSTRTGSGVTIGDGLGSITAYADDEACVTADVATATADVLLRLGPVGQPEACSREGAFVTFQEGRGFWLATSMVLEPGTRETLSNFAPVPPGAPKPSPTLYLVISGAALGARDADGRTLGESLGTLTVYAGGEVCTTVDVSTAGNELIVPLGPEQPAACSREGAVVTFQDGQGRWLSTWLTFRTGGRETLANFAPTPPCSRGPCATPGPSPTPAPSSSPAPATPDGIAPPSVGSGGLLLRVDTVGRRR